MNNTVNNKAVSTFISTSISKLGANIPSINLPPVLTCNPNAPCFKGCYARKGHFCFDSVKQRYLDNLYFYKENPKQYFEDVVNATRLSLYARWHSSGDIVDEKYLEGMCKVARKNKNTQYLAFTKQFPIVNKYVADGHRIPKNLHIVYSCWKNWIPDNPYNFPTTWVYFPNDKDDTNKLIPKKAKPCDGKCDMCQKCWNLKKGESVVFKKH